MANSKRIGSTVCKLNFPEVVNAVVDIGGTPTYVTTNATCIVVRHGDNKLTMIWPTMTVGTVMRLLGLDLATLESAGLRSWKTSLVYGVRDGNVPPGNYTLVVGDSWRGSDDDAVVHDARIARVKAAWNAMRLRELHARDASLAEREQALVDFVKSPRALVQRLLDLEATHLSSWRPVVDANDGIVRLAFFGAAEKVQTALIGDAQFYICTSICPEDLLVLHQEIQFLPVEGTVIKEI